ncbi:hypothetical protein [Leyella stercorea]|uniref:hypothetical protein n=1 Tax=Leyella stercorea TaxID=363265 RepID=UPI002FE00F70
MSTRLKFILTYIGGLITGVVLVFVLFFCAAANNSNPSSENKDLVLFDKPKPEVIEGSFKVVQVLPDGSALATYDEIFTNKLEGGLRYGTAVKFLATEESAFYDNQIINLSKGECFRIIGTYHYMNVEGNEKTVPVIGIFKK